MASSVSGLADGPNHVRCGSRNVVQAIVLPNSENVLGSELHTARVAGRGDRTELRRPEVPVRKKKVRVVRGVERFHADLQPLALSDHDVLEYGEIQISKAGTVDGVASGAAKRSGRLQLESRG